MKSNPSDVFRVLGVPTRLGILQMLQTEGPSPVKTIAARLGVTPAAVSQHMKALKFAGLVTSERQGYWVPYSVDAEALERCCGMLIQVCTCPEPSSDNAGLQGAGVEKTALEQRRAMLQKELTRVEKKLGELEVRKE